MTGRIFLKLIIGVFCVLLLALVSVDYGASEVARDANIRNVTQQLTEKGRMLALLLPDPAAWGVADARRMAIAAGGRITVVRSDGKVLVDSEADAAGMESQAKLPELMAAWRGQTGSTIRRSATSGAEFLYVAVPLAGGAIRMAIPLSEIDRQARLVREKILFSTAVAFLPAIAIAAVFSRWISERFAAILSHAGELARGNFRARVVRPGKSEFGQLGHTLNALSENLQRTVEQLQREHAELERVERVRKDFVINVSHELRTPLASIQGYTETLIDGALGDPQHNMRFLRIIRHNAERLARITEDLLTLSRIEQRRQKFEFEPHSVNGLIEQAVESIRPIALKSGLQLHLEPAPAGSEAWCDSEAVSQILSNLLDNAIKYTPAGGRITVGARPALGFVEFYVRDTGIGIPQEEQPRLFERFYRVDKARSRELGGTGLGLSIVKHLVAAHHGSARVESLLNQGSTFFFTLPVDESSLGEAHLNPEFTAP